ncbi:MULTISPECIES: very short patch repair endonuclease [Rugamonas]|uniref:DNA mismatch endonuclease Vsr n=2 Tax=Rugamonas TaxID=212744 RepID=A0A843SMJ4_9BURK|nr:MULTISPECIES: very short patch repair endonuclease [Rugamonas]MQA23240.1 DNA mismatch endonuclease Vsr [Rugamonas rivuli]MQA42266.1 DNA mismatch endonuclease Vsr [Rugamonas aquatica]
MVDVLSVEQRRRNMSRIRSRDTKPELFIRRGLHALGLRYRLQDGKLPGRPDLVFSRFHAVIFVHGCFWHGHNCSMFKLPQTRQEFWKAKIASNRARDVRTTDALLEKGWRIVNVWECSLKGPGKLPDGEVLKRCFEFLMSKEVRLVDISGVLITNDEKHK